MKLWSNKIVKIQLFEFYENLSIRHNFLNKFMFIKYGNESMAYQEGYEADIILSSEGREDGKCDTNVTIPLTILASLSGSKIIATLQCAFLVRVQGIMNYATLIWWDAHWWVLYR